MKESGLIADVKQYNLLKINKDLILYRESYVSMKF